MKERVCVRRFFRLLAFGALAMGGLFQVHVTSSSLTFSIDGVLVSADR
jgi:hypothetical protein